MEVIHVFLLVWTRYIGEMIQKMVILKRFTDSFLKMRITDTWNSSFTQINSPVNNDTDDNITQQQ